MNMSSASMHVVPNSNFITSMHVVPNSNFISLTNHINSKPIQ